MDRVGLRDDGVRMFCEVLKKKSGLREIRCVCRPFALMRGGRRSNACASRAESLVTAHHGASWQHKYVNDKLMLVMAEALKTSESVQFIEYGMQTRSGKEPGGGGGGSVAEGQAVIGRADKVATPSRPCRAAFPRMATMASASPTTR